MEKQTDKQLFEDSEVIDGFRYLRWNKVMIYGEDCRKEVEKETIKMADSIIAYEKVYDKYKKTFERFKLAIRSKR